MSELLSFFKSDFLLHNAFVGSLVVGIFCPLIGVYFYVRRMVLLGVALPQVSAAGIAFAFFLQGLGLTWSLHPGEHNDRFLALAGSLVFTLAAIYILALLEKRGEGTTESRLGTLYAASFACSLLFVTQNAVGRTEFLSLLNGEIVSISTQDLHLMVGTYSVLAIILLMFNAPFLLTSYDRDMAQVLGKNTVLWDALLYSLLALAISIGVLMVGPMLTFAFLIIPPLAARRFCRSMRGFFILSAAFGAFSGLIGFFLSYHFDWPLAPSAIVVATLFLFGAFVVKKMQIVFHRHHHDLSKQ